MWKYIIFCLLLMEKLIIILNVCNNYHKQNSINPTGNLSRLKSFFLTTIFLMRYMWYDMTITLFCNWMINKSSLIRKNIKKACLTGSFSPKLETNDSYIIKRKNYILESDDPYTFLNFTICIVKFSSRIAVINKGPCVSSRAKTDTLQNNRPVNG